MGNIKVILKYKMTNYNNEEYDNKKERSDFCIIYLLFIQKLYNYRINT
jgi:hypothetical protein